MAGTTVAYSEITILDLIDTATYIYYSENESGSGATIAPTATTKYIGIYSGPPVEGGQPKTPPAETEWTKYVGEDGAPGEGVTVSEVKYEYAKSTNGQTPPKTGWQSTVPSLSGGDYLWSRTIITYSDGQTVTTDNVSYSGIDGSDANTYYIETNQEEILFFKQLEEDEQGNKVEKIVFSPSTFSFKVYNNPKQSNSEQIGLEEENYRLEIQKNQNFEKIQGGFLTLGQTILNKNDAGTEEVIIVDPETVFFDMVEYYDGLQDKEEIFSADSQIFRFSYLVNNEIAAIKIFQLRKGVSEDMATFNLHASGFNSAIQHTKLDFSAEGLKIFNGGIKIINKNQEPVFYADNDSGNLTLKGTIYATNGEFTGKVIAKEGEFNGTISASGGTIGGFTILNHYYQLTQLSDLNKKTLYIKTRVEEENYYPITVQKIAGTNTENYYIYGQYPFEKDEPITFNGYYNFLNNEYVKVENPINGDKYYVGINLTDFNKYYEDLGPRLISPSQQIVLDGTNGSMIAENIQLGTGAKITNYIELGDAKIYNPSNNGNKFIEAGNILLTSNGVLSIGSITLNGDDSSIYGDNFSISPTLARFSNIDCSGVIRSAIFEKNKIQCVGGSMLFRPSYKITSIENGSVFLEGTFNEFNQFEGKPNEKVLLISSEGKYFEYNISEVKNYGSQIKLENLDKTEYVSLVYVGTDNSITIGINAGQGTILDNIFGEGLTITKWNSQAPNLFLGNLERLSIKDLKLSGYGLYSDNVYLKGSLTTTIPSEGEDGSIKSTYAGINTNSGEQIDSENIVFWAGATSQETINQAPFLVTENGTIHARKGYFEESIIAQSTITGSHLYTTHLHGCEIKEQETKKAPLYIHDTEYGIRFNAGYQPAQDNQEEDFGTTILQLGSNGFKLSVSESDENGFIYIHREEGQDPSVVFNGKSINTEKAKLGYLSLEKNSITSLEAEGNENSLISFVSQNGFYFKNFSEDLFFINSSEVQNKTGHLITQGNFTIQGEKRKMAYKLGSNGYDLYIS